VACTKNKKAAISAALMWAQLGSNRCERKEMIRWIILVSSQTAGGFEPGNK